MSAKNHPSLREIEEPLLQMHSDFSSQLRKTADQIVVQLWYGRPHQKMENYQFDDYEMHLLDG
jgi:hypothetical protein